MRYHGNEGDFSMAGVDTMELIRFTADEEIAEIESSIQGEDWSDTDGGLKSMSVQATLHLDSAQATPDAGTVGGLTLKIKDGATPGTMAGTFIITRVGLPYQLNSNVVVDLTLKNKGEVTKVPAVA
ncbi:MAG: hypothetical protein KC983_05530 [Phycisphaerales bacterium]|nr:hypothetical protein [Phycisphaerales bacterium]